MLTHTREQAAKSSPAYIGFLLQRWMRRGFWWAAAVPAAPSLESGLLDSVYQHGGADLLLMALCLHDRIGSTGAVGAPQTRRPVWCSSG